MTKSSGVVLSVLQSLRAHSGDDDPLYWLISAVIDRHIGASDETVMKDIGYATRAMKRDMRQEKANEV